MPNATEIDQQCFYKSAPDLQVMEDIVNEFGSLVWLGSLNIYEDELPAVLGALAADKHVALYGSVDIEPE